MNLRQLTWGRRAASAGGVKGDAVAALWEAAGHSPQSSSTLLPALAQERCHQPGTVTPRSPSPTLGVAASVVKHSPQADALRNTPASWWGEPCRARASYERWVTATAIALGD